MDFDLILSLGVTILFQSIKNPEKRAQLKKLCLKVVSTIKTAYAGDPDFA